MDEGAATGPLRIAFLVRGDEGYGARRITRDLAGALTLQGHAMSAIALQPGGMADALAAAGLPLTRLGTEPLNLPSGRSMTGRMAAQITRQWRLRKAGAALRQLGERETPDAVIVGQGDLLAIGGAFAARAGARCLWLMNSAVSDAYPLSLNKRLYWSTIGRYGIVPVANSAFTAATLGPAPIPPRVLHLGADPAHFDPDGPVASRTALAVPDQAPLAVIAARLIAGKGHGVLLEALAALGAAAGDLHLLIAGGPLESSFAEALRARAADPALQGRVHFAGPVEDPAPLLRAADIAINARLDAEPFGLSVIEAMMLGKPVLVHARGGPAETVDDGATGWHVGAPTPAAFAAGLRRALADRARWPNMGLAARATARARFAIDGVAARLASLIAAAAPCATRSRFAAMRAALG